MTQLGTRLAVVDTYAYCDRYPQHESRIITDGTAVYAVTTGTAPVQHTEAWRDGPAVHLTCARPDRYDEPCGGTIEAPLTDWTPDPQVIELLAAYGTQVDQ